MTKKMQLIEELSSKVTSLSGHKKKSSSESSQDYKPLIDKLQKDVDDAAQQQKSDVAQLKE